MNAIGAYVKTERKNLVWRRRSLRCGRDWGFALSEIWNKERKQCGWHAKCIKSFFGTAQFPTIDLSEHALKLLADENVNRGLTVPGVPENIICRRRMTFFLWMLSWGQTQIRWHLPFMERKEIYIGMIFWRSQKTAVFLQKLQKRWSVHCWKRRTRFWTNARMHSFLRNKSEKWKNC